MEDTEPSSELRPQQPSPVAADTAGLSSQQPWKYDIATEHASLTTTGGRIWDAARRLASYLEAMSGPLGLQRPGLRVLELGAGLGWLGMTLARNIRVDPRQGGMVVLTEQEAGGGLDWLRHNLRLNAAALGLQGEGLQEGGLQQGGRQAAASVGQQEGQGRQGQGGEGQQQGQQQQQGQGQQPAVRAEACDWFLYCNPDLVTARAGAVAGDRGDQGSQDGGGGGGATGAAAGSATGQATASADAGTVAASRRYAEPLAPGASLAAAGLAAAATAAAATTAAATTATAVAATAVTAVATAAVAGAAGGTGADGCSGRGGSDTGAGSGAGDGGGGGGGGEWLSGVVWDLIIGSDLVYNEVGAVYLPRVLRALSRPGHTRVLYAHTKHRFDTWDMRFYEELAAQGLSLAEVHEPGVPSPPPSPPPLTELFPDMRVAVFQIGLEQPPK